MLLYNNSNNKIDNEAYWASWMSHFLFLKGVCGGANKNKNCDINIVGYFEATQPIVLCKDVEMIKHVMVRFFSFY